MSESVQGTILSSHHAFYLRDRDSLHSPRYDDKSNGLVSTQPNGLAMIFTGVDTGEVNVAVDVRDREPPVEIDDWEEVVEVSLYAPYGEVEVAGVAGETETSHVYPLLTQSGPGHYRLRIHARGRDTEAFPDSNASEGDPQAEWDPDTEFAHLDEPSSENYLILTWPAPQASVTILKQTDRVGEELRGGKPRPRGTQ